MYQALYRQYRPKTFDEVLGQEHIVTTLKNQIEKGHIGHAYLFSGTKGTGKTSMAKIFARAVNCTNPLGGNPCNQCEACRNILDESAMDVIEMDAASHNSVDDIRELRDKVIYPPANLNYKVYIVDEVHMLSKGAANALLKILEEPPKHLIFILATTEMERLPTTILSRCQRFEFRRIANGDMVGRMEEICGELKVEVEARALNLIARNSDGSMRDALSLLDQCLSYREDKLRYEDALAILGIANTDLLFTLVDHIIDRDLESLLYKIDDMLQEGKDIGIFIKDLIQHFRNILIMKISQDSKDLLGMDRETISMYSKQAEKISIDGLLESLNILNASEAQARWASRPRIILEMALIKLINSTNQEGLEERLKNLEKIIEAGRIESVLPTNPKELEEIREEIGEKEIKKTEEDLETIEGSGVGDMSLNTIRAEWNKILELIREEDIRTHAFLKEGSVASFSSRLLSIAYPDGYGIHKEAMESPKNKELVLKILNSYLGEPINIKFIMADEEGKDMGETDEFQEVIDFFGKDLVEFE